MKHIKPFNENLYIDRDKHIKAIMMSLSDDVDGELIYQDSDSGDEYYEYRYFIQLDGGVKMTGGFDISQMNKLIDFNGKCDNALKTFKKAMLKLTSDSILHNFVITHYITGYKYEITAYVKTRDEL